MKRSVVPACRSRYRRLLAVVTMLVAVSSAAACGHPSSGLPAGPSQLQSYSAATPTSASTPTPTPTHTPTITPTPTPTIKTAAEFCSLLAQHSTELLSLPTTTGQATSLLAVWRTVEAAAPAALKAQSTEITATVGLAAEGKWDQIKAAATTKDFDAVTSWASLNCSG